MPKSPRHRHQKTTVGHPVDVFSGSVYTAWHDFELPGFIALIWRRFYNTANLSRTPLGNGWASQLFMHILDKDDHFHLMDEEGQVVIFSKPEQTKSLQPEAQMELKIDGLNLRVWDWHHQRHYTFSTSSSQDTYLLTSIKDYSGNSITIQYDDLDRLFTIKQSSIPRKLVFKYEIDNLIRSIDLYPNKNSPITLVEYTYDAAGNLVKATDPTGASIKYFYDQNHRLITEVNQLGGAFNFEYGLDGRCIRSWGDNGYLERQLQYDVKRKITRVADSLGGMTTYFFNDSGQVRKKVDSLGSISEYQSTPGVSIKKNALGYARTEEFDQNSNRIKYIDPLGGEFTYTYNALNLCTSITDPEGHCRKWLYDDRGNLAGFEDPLENRWTIDIGQRGEIFKETDPEGRELIRLYGDDLSWVEIADGLGKFRTEFDLKGHPIISSDSEGVLCHYETDGLGRITAQRMSDNSKIEFSYDKAGNLTTVKYSNGECWEYEYDSFNHVIRTISPNGRSVRIKYDTEGRRTKITNDKGDAYKEKYDLNGQMIERQFFDGRIERFVYDAGGQVLQVHRSDGKIIYREYDACSNMTEEGLLTKSNDHQENKTVLATYDYNWRRKMTTAKNASATINFYYDPAGRFVGERQNDFVVKYEYDNSRKLISREILNGVVGKVVFKYDASGYLEAIGDKNGAIQEFKNNSRGLVKTRTMRGGLVESFRYDQKSRMVNQTVSNLSGGIVQRRYDYDLSDNILSTQDAYWGGCNFKYDGQLQLIQAAETSGEIEEFELSISGDILKINATNFQYAPGDHLLAVGDTTFEYDDNGNVQSKKETNQQTRYFYDAKGQLTQVILANGEVTKFKYDPIGRRIEKRSEKGVTNFIWSHDQLAAVIHDENIPIEILLGYGTWRPSVQWTGTEVEHYITDPIGKPREVIGCDGKVKWRGNYSAYGNANKIVTDNPENYCIRFPGQYEDIETGLFYNTHRYYDPMQTRYLTPDPLGIISHINIYNYTQNPINWIDPLGLRCPNPQLIDENPQMGWRCFLHDNGDMVMEVDCRRAFANMGASDRMLRSTRHTGEDAAMNNPECYVGRDGRIQVTEGLHRGAAAARGAEIPPDQHNPHLGGVPGRPGYMRFQYESEHNEYAVNDPVPLRDLQYPSDYPHQLPSS